MAKPVPNPNRPKRPERIRRMIDLMTSGGWITGRTSKVLAVEWKLSLGIVKEEAAEASRYINREVIANDELKSKLHAILETTIADCELIKRTNGLQSRLTIDALRTKVDAVRALAGIHQLEPTRITDSELVLNALMYRSLCERGWVPPPVAGLPVLDVSSEESSRQETEDDDATEDDTGDPSQT